MYPLDDNHTGSIVGLRCSPIDVATFRTFFIEVFRTVANLSAGTNPQFRHMNACIREGKWPTFTAALSDCPGSLSKGGISDVFV